MNVTKSSNKASKKATSRSSAARSVTASSRAPAAPPAGAQAGASSASKAAKGTARSLPTEPKALRSTRKAPSRASASKSGTAASTEPTASTGVHATVEEYIGSLSGWQSSVVRTICNIVRATAPNATESIKSSQPTYEENGPFCYVQAFSGSVNFGFWRGAELNDPRRLLKGDGNKMRHVKLTGERDVDPRAFAGFVKQAVELNRRLGDPSR